MSPEANPALLSRLAAALNKKDTSAVEELFSPNFVVHHPLLPGWPRGFDTADLQEAKALLQELA